MKTTQETINQSDAKAILSVLLDKMVWDADIEIYRLPEGENMWLSKSYFDNTAQFIEEPQLIEKPKKFKAQVA